MIHWSSFLLDDVIRDRYVTEGKDSRETVAVSTNDNDEDARAQHQRALLHNAPKPIMIFPGFSPYVQTFGTCSS
jgi:hypothetical protein